MSKIQEFGRLSNKLIIDDELVSGSNSDVVEVISPVSEVQIARLCEATEHEVQLCIDSSNSAQKLWAAQNSLDRAKALHQVSNALNRNNHVLAEVMTKEMGKPLKEARDEFTWCCSAFDYYAEIARHEYGRMQGPASANLINFSYKEPLGVIVLIMPFNYPAVLLAWSAAAALATGNSVIVKPSEYASITTLKMIEVINKELPGLVQVVTGGKPVVKNLIENPGTHAVSFTGSVNAALEINASCAKVFKRCVVEASGSDPFIIMPSADMRTVVRAATFSSFMNCGQICTSTEKIYVHGSVYDEFVDRFAEETAKLRIGDGLCNVDIGPMANNKERLRVEMLVHEAVGEGANIVAGGKRPKSIDQGWFYEPTVITDASHEMRIVKNEVFGPAVTVHKIDSLDEAIRLSNNCELALGSIIFSQDLDEVHEFIRRIDSGMVWVNAPLLDNDASPFGGNKLTGGGRVLGIDGMNAFTKTKIAMIDPDPATNHSDFWWFPYTNK